MKRVSSPFQAPITLFHKRTQERRERKTKNRFPSSHTTQSLIVYVESRAYHCASFTSSHCVVSTSCSPYVLLLLRGKQMRRRRLLCRRRVFTRKTDITRTRQGLSPFTCCASRDEEQHSACLLTRIFPSLASRRPPLCI